MRAIATVTVCILGLTTLGLAVMTRTLHPVWAVYAAFAAGGFAFTYLTDGFRDRG